MFGRIFFYTIAEKLLIYKGKKINYQSKYIFWLVRKCNSLLLKVKWSVLDHSVIAYVKSVCYNQFLWISTVYDWPFGIF
jgi:hypothetical protein